MSFEIRALCLGLPPLGLDAVRTGSSARCVGTRVFRVFRRLSRIARVESIGGPRMFGGRAAPERHKDEEHAQRHGLSDARDCPLFTPLRGSSRRPKHVRW